MTVTDVRVGDHVHAVVDHLNAAGVLAGHGAPPDGHGWQGPPGQSEFARYAIVWRIGSKDRARWSLQGDVDEGRVTVFVRCFGGTISEAQELLDDAAAALLARDADGYLLQVPGRKVLHVAQDVGTTSTETNYAETGLPEAGDYWTIRTVPGDD